MGSSCTPEFEPLRQWLSKQIYQHGRRYLAGELVERVTGQPPSHDAMIRHLRDRFGPLYELAS
jgi:carboxypeptidase Taq